MLPLNANASTTYTIEGPYYDNREVVNGSVTVTLRYANDSIYSFTLTGDGATPDSETIISTNQLTQASWNASTALNYTRFYDFTSSSDTSLDIHIPSPDEIAYVYYFTVSDFYGMTTAYLETQTTDDGSTYYTVERKLINQGTLGFVLTQFYDYNLMFTNDKGDDNFEYYLVTYTPETLLTMDLPVLPGSFPTTIVNGTDVSAIRLNSTTIQASYADGDEITDWLYFEITHLESGFEITDYTLNMSDTDAFTLTWNLADSETDYLLDIQAYRAGYLYEWEFSCPTQPDDNPWDDVFDFLGTWPEGVEPAQIVVSGLVLAFLCVGSVRTLGASCVIAWIIGAIFLAIGWWGPSIPTFILAGVLSVLIAIAEGKETTREV